MKTLKIGFVLVVILALAACGTPPANMEQPGGAEQPSMPQDGSGPAVSGMADETKLEAQNMLQAIPALSAQEEQALVEQARQDLQKRLPSALSGGAEPGQLQDFKAQVNPVIWQDGGLGCASEGAGQAPGMAPGYIILLESDGQTYEYHAGIDHQVIFCEDPLPVAAGGSSSEGSVGGAGSGGVDNGGAGGGSGSGSAGRGRKLVNQARQDLAAQLSVDISAITLVNFSEVTWPDTSLGCPQPDMAYAQILVPGYLIVLENAGMRYEYHGSREGGMIRCGGQSPAASGLDALVQKAIRDLSNRLSIQTAEITLVESSEMLWPDTSLGCPQPGMAYAQIVTPGYLIKLSAAGRDYDYHTNKVDGLVYCGKNTPPSNSMLNILTDKAEQDLAWRLGILTSAISLQEATEVVWPDASLGCPQPDKAYAQMPTPGFQIILTYANMQYEYHTDMHDQVIFCDHPVALPGTAP